jgi:hypothetical protein
MRDEELLALMRTARDASQKVHALTAKEQLLYAQWAAALAVLQEATLELSQAQEALVAKVCPAA